MSNISSLLANGIDIKAVTARPEKADRRYRHNKVNPAGARAIRRLIHEGRTQKEVAEMFSLSQPAVSKIARSQVWVEDEIA